MMYAGVNQTSAGVVLDASQDYELVSAEYLDKDRPVEPVWLNFLGRWGASNKAHLSLADVLRVVNAAFGPVLNAILQYFGSFPLLFAELLLPLVKQEQQDGPRALKQHSEWDGLK